jgi:hypothetical protein
MRRSTILLGAAVALAAAVAFAWYAPTVLVAAPLWIMALCVITGYRRAPDADAASPGTSVDLRPGRDALTVVPGGLADPATPRRAAG